MSALVSFSPGENAASDTDQHHYFDIARITAAIGADMRTPESLARSLPFCASDATSGTENELCAVVAGSSENVDLPKIITESRYYKNLLKRVGSGENPEDDVIKLNAYLGENTGVWENSWVSFPAGRLNAYATEVFANDLLADKGNPQNGLRGDHGKFMFQKDGASLIRVPVSYLLKLSLAQVLGAGKLTGAVAETGHRLMGHFINDNTSPETHSFDPVGMTAENRMGGGIAKETARRFLFTQVLLEYANVSLGLAESGQRALAYLAPHPPVRQKELNDCISDSFYRELFMSPCLSGWDRGEEKHRYMHLCHQVLSRSQLNCLSKLREAGILNNNLVILPNTSNVSLANNGTHLSLGSKKLGRLLADPKSGFSDRDEKFIGDLVIKIVEHFLPLFVGTYSAAPYRLDFSDFHPEKVLGFLPHELHYTHLRMFWRRWKKKARLKVFGRPVTPFGPSWIDSRLAKSLGLEGDFIDDYRLLDYLACLLSTDESPALNGQPGNDSRLLADLAGMGVFDSQMSVYLLYKLRRRAVMGFSGYEGRHYSLFPGFAEDMAPAAALQALVTAYAWQVILKGEVSHDRINDDPFTESERRQAFFGSAIGLPTFFVKRDTKNRFLVRILSHVKNMRFSRRYPGFLRVPLPEYRKALVTLLETEAGAIIEQMNLKTVMADLSVRLNCPATHSAAGRLTTGILKKAGATSPMKLSSREFALAAEDYYREDLRAGHMREAFGFLQKDMAKLDGRAALGRDFCREALGGIIPNGSAFSFCEKTLRNMWKGDTDAKSLEKLLSLMIFCVHNDAAEAQAREKYQAFG